MGFEGKTAVKFCPLERPLAFKTREEKICNFLHIFGKVWKTFKKQTTELLTVLNFTLPFCDYKQFLAPLASLETKWTLGLKSFDCFVLKLRRKMVPRQPKDPSANVACRSPQVAESLNHQSHSLISLWILAWEMATSCTGIRKTMALSECKYQSLLQALPWLKFQTKDFCFLVRVLAWSLVCFCFRSCIMVRHTRASILAPSSPRFAWKVPWISNTEIRSASIRFFSVNVLVGMTAFTGIPVCRIQKNNKNIRFKEAQGEAGALNEPPKDPQHRGKRLDLISFSVLPKHQGESKRGIHQRL